MLHAAVADSDVLLGLEDIACNLLLAFQTTNVIINTDEGFLTLRVHRGGKSQSFGSTRSARKKERFPAFQGTYHPAIKYFIVVNEPELLGSTM